MIRAATVHGADGGVDADVPLERLQEAAADRGGFAWVDLVDPSERELAAVAAELGLHALLVEDIAARGQRTKLEPYGDVRYLVLHRPDGDGPPQEVHVVAAPAWVVTATWGEAGAAWIDGVRERVAAADGDLRPSPGAVVHAVLDAVGDEVLERAEALDDEAQALEERALGDAPPAAEESYRALRQVARLARLAEPLADVVGRFGTAVPEDDPELRRHVRDVADHVQRAANRLEAQHALVQGMLQLQAARVAERQNEHMEALAERSFEQGEQVKRVTSWAAILFAPTLIAGVYGMNFRAMPELHWALGYPFALLLMLVFSVGLYVAFKRKHWL